MFSDFRVSNIYGILSDTAGLGLFFLTWSSTAMPLWPLAMGSLALFVLWLSGSGAGPVTWSSVLTAFFSVMAILEFRLSDDVPWLPAWPLRDSFGRMNIM